jgi:hypothetical protein
MYRYAIGLVALLSPGLIASPGLLVLPSARAADIPAAHKPDASAVLRFGPAYRYPQAGWIVLHVEGEPYPRGYQQGRLLATEIAAYVKVLAQDRYSKDPVEGWRTVRTLTDALFVRKFDREFLEEMKGIADGAAAAGAKFNDRALDLIDIAAVNVWQEIATLDTALAASPTGLEGVKFPKPDSESFPPAPVAPKQEHCSAFAAVGPATADGKIVFGHITMFGLHFGPFVNVWIDCQPAKGHRFVMQAFPGGVWSSQDYYQNDAGILLCETTIDQSPFDPAGEPLTTRARKAIQYAESIDDVVKLLSANNNGLYTNEWLIADTKTNEIAMFELGTRTSKLWRSSKDEWFGGTKGFYWGCNNAKDAKVRLECARAAAEHRPERAQWQPSGRDRAWIRFYEKYRGKIDPEAAKVAFGAPPLAAPSSLDAKVTTTALAGELAAHALYGPPTGRTWTPGVKETVRFPDIRPLVSHPWTVVTTNPPPSKSDGRKVADLSEKATPSLPFSERIEPEEDPETEPAWHGTVLPKDDNSQWLIGAIAPYERIVALSKTIEKRDGAAAAAERMELDLFAYRADWRASQAAAERRPAVRKSQEAGPLDLKPVLDRDRWMREQIGAGVAALHALRQKYGPESFDAAMDSFGKAHHRGAASVEDLVKSLGQRMGPVVDVACICNESRSSKAEPRGVFSTRSFRDELEDCLIVYGTLDDAAANRNAARALQELIRLECEGVKVEMESDTAATDARLAAKHLLIIGGPECNAIAARSTEGLPVTFKRRTCTLNGGAHKGETYAHPNTCVIAVGANPLNPRYSVVVLAGLSAAATNDAPEFLMNENTPAAEVLIGPAGRRVLPMVLSPAKP